MSKKVSKNNVHISTIETASKKVRGNNVEFSTSKVTPIKVRGKNGKWKKRGFFDHRNYIEKSTWKKHGFFDQQNYVEKVRGNDVDFSTIKITSKKYPEMRWKFVKIWSSMYRHNTHVELMWIRCGVPVG